MQDIDWDDLRYFLAVSESGSLSGAARHLNVNHSTVLRRLGSLERKLEVRLFDRMAGGYAITPAGEELHERLRDVAEQIDAAKRRLSGLDLKLSGPIRVTSTDTLLSGLLTPCLAEFRKLHPGIQLQVVINNTFLNLTRREADVAIRPSNKPPDHLVGRRIGRVRTAVYASKSYLKRSSKKKEWAEHDWVAPDEGMSHLAQAKWIREHVPEQRIALRIDSLLGMVEAVRSGIGMGLLLCLLADDQPNLVRLTEPLAEMDTQVWILTHAGLKRVARIKAFTDFLYDRLSQSGKIAPNAPHAKDRSADRVAVKRGRAT